MCPNSIRLAKFLHRQNVLGIYRNMLRTIRRVPDEADRKFLRDWAREEFHRNKNVTHEVHSCCFFHFCFTRSTKSHCVIRSEVRYRSKKINSEQHLSFSPLGLNVQTVLFNVSVWSVQDAIRMMITQASNHLAELQKSLALAHS